MTNAQPPSPGWYRVSDGSSQWWNGQEWSAPPPGLTQPTHRAAPTPPAQRSTVVAAAHPAQTVIVMQQPPKSVGVAYLFAILLGEFGAHRFYLGRPVSAIIVMVLWLTGIATAWLVVGFILLLPAFIWWIIDLCILPGMVREANRRAGSRLGIAAAQRA